MALRDQPYFPLYVQDFLTDEKLIECSAAATGVYIRLLCIMHKSQEYGTILLRQKDKQISSKIEAFAKKLQRNMPYTLEEILSGITELINEDVIQIDGDKLVQKRMIRENKISIMRSNAGSRGGFAKAKSMAKALANNENENENENENILFNKARPNKSRFVPPTKKEVEDYCRERKNKVSPDDFVDFYTSKGWKVGKNSMIDWRASVRLWERNKTDPAHKKDNKMASDIPWEEPDYMKDR